MSRTTSIITAVAAAAVLTTPAAALAGTHHHKAAKVHSHHVRHAKTTRVITTPAAATPAATVTVASFANGVLTLTLADGSTTKGTVDQRTELECEAATPAATTATVRSHDGREPAGEDQSGGDDNASGDDQGDDDAAQGACDTTKLVAGTVVRKAKLVIADGTSRFDELKLEVPAS